MTELDRLHDIADDIDRTAWGRELADALHVIAAHIGEEFDHMRDLSGYESDVMAWVEKNGGLDAVKERMMPEDMSWPRYEDGSLVEIGDDVVGPDRGERIHVDEVTIHANGFTLRSKGGDGKWYESDDRFKRPDKVLDADGAEIEVGDDLYSVEGGLKLHVGVIDTRNGKIATAAMYALDKWADPAMYTHRAPVLAADGKPLREGETVWTVNDGYKGIVTKIDDGIVDFKGADGGYGTACLPSEQLTHERPAPPDSWERLEKDANKAVCIYFGVNTKACSECAHNSWECSFDKDLDLVRRAKALAERGQ